MSLFQAVARRATPILRSERLSLSRLASANINPTAVLTGERKMSSDRKAEVLRVEEVKSDVKWIKTEKIHWRDEDGKEVPYPCAESQFLSMVLTVLLETLGGSEQDHEILIGNRLCSSRFELGPERFTEPET